uniref:TetR family transcriptional regulator n=1 Tax=Streptomyces milbemycinicus TaxID=476552 RepID=UPI001FEC436F
MQYVPHMSQPLKATRTPRTNRSNSSTGSGSTGNRRASAQRLTMRRKLAAAAMELFATQGYEATTVDEIA